MKTSRSFLLFLFFVSFPAARAKFGLRGAPTQRWTEESQEEVYKHRIPLLQKILFLRGMSPWVFNDFRSPIRQIPGIQDGFNRKGLVSDGKRKKLFRAPAVLRAEGAQGTAN